MPPKEVLDAIRVTELRRYAETLRKLAKDIKDFAGPAGAVERCLRAAEFIDAEVGVDG